MIKGYWWAVATSRRREFYVRGGLFFNSYARKEAEERLDPGEFIVSWCRKEEIT